MLSCIAINSIPFYALSSIADVNIPEENNDCVIVLNCLPFACPVN
jgi:hypothetical protein